MKKLIYTVICSAAAISLAYTSAFALSAYAAVQTANTTTAAEEITDPETIIDLISAFIAENELNAVCRYETHYELYPEYDGRVVIEYDPDDNALEIAAVIKEFAISHNIPTYCLGVVRIKDGKPYTPSANENKKVSGDVYAAFDSGEKAVPVKIYYQQTGIDWEKLNEQAREAAAIYVQTLDPAIYTADEIAQKQDAYFEKSYNDAYSAELHARAAEILKVLGISPEDATIYAVTPYITCKLTQEQLISAEQNPQIKKIVKAYAWTYSDEPGTEAISDADTIRAMITKLIQENDLAARCVDNTAYAGYSEPVIVEWDVIEGEIPAGMIVLDFAEKYHIDRYVYTTIAVINGVPQVIIPATPKINPGDANCDGSIDVSDAVLIARFAAEDREATITDQGRQNADVTHDGNVDAQDATKILQYIAKKISYVELAEGRYAFTAVYTRTQGISGDSGQQPLVRQFSSRDELDTYIAENKEALQASSIGDETRISFPDAASKYTSAWFDEHKLLIVCLTEDSGSVRHEVTGVSEGTVSISRSHTTFGTGDMAYWHILIELDQSAKISDDIQVLTVAADPLK